MKINLGKIGSYGIESLVILFSIILSFYIEGRRDLAKQNTDKNKLIIDLITTIDEDIEQIDYIRSQPSWQYDDEELDVNEEIGLDIKKYVDEHPEIHFETDGDTDETFTYIGQILNDYLHY